ncbi:hypothetical protein J43TS3_12580 [Ornithinibacillus bavariensis]|uniref:Uncharacterized protein n=1 Tax=Ornithinibacillus bavariensis TaxID=545502 RepID=A0A919X924_9BACI|nr:hypothetical protein J43TS3_12580 [Ornithinibacillus bavariensis]
MLLHITPIISVKSSIYESYKKTGIPGADYNILSSNKNDGLIKKRLDLNIPNLRQSINSWVPFFIQVFLYAISHSLTAYNHPILKTPGNDATFSSI